MKLIELKLARIKRSKSQMLLEAQTGIDQVVISRIERGAVEATEEQKRLLAKALRAPVKALFPVKRKREKPSAASLLTGALKES